MESMQSSIVSVNNRSNEKVYVKLCTRPASDQAAIFNALHFKHRPYVRKTKVVPQLQKTKMPYPDYQLLMVNDLKVGLKSTKKSENLMFFRR